MIAAHKNILVAPNIRQKNKLLRKVDEMMAAQRNAVVIANIRQKNQPFVVPTPVGRLIIFDTETTRLGTWDRIVEIGAVELLYESTQPRIAGILCCHFCVLLWLFVFVTCFLEKGFLPELTECFSLATPVH